MSTAAAHLGVHRPPPRAVGRIRRQSTFRALRRPEGRAARGAIQATFVAPTRGDAPFPQVGYAISRRCGNAVTRNRLRRQLRSIARAAVLDGLPAGSYLITTRPAAVTLDYRTLAAHVAEVLRRAGGVPEAGR